MTSLKSALNSSLKRSLKCTIILLIHDQALDIGAIINIELPILLNFFTFYFNPVFCINVAKLSQILTRFLSFLVSIRIVPFFFKSSTYLPLLDYPSITCRELYDEFSFKSVNSFVTILELLFAK